MFSLPGVHCFIWDYNSDLDPSPHYSRVNIVCLGLMQDSPRTSENCWWGKGVIGQKWEIQFGYGIGLSSMLTSRLSQFLIGKLLSHLNWYSSPRHNDEIGKKCQQKTEDIDDILQVMGNIFICFGFPLNTLWQTSLPATCLRYMKAGS